jgi:hypothetical protein
MSNRLRGEQLKYFTSVVLMLPIEVRRPVITQIRWVDLLNKCPTSHSSHLLAIAHIADFFMQSKSYKADDEMKKPLFEYFASHRESMSNMIYHIKSIEYAQFYTSILILAKIDSSMMANLFKKASRGLFERFELSPEIGGSVSRFLYLLYAIDPNTIHAMILYPKVNEALKGFFGLETIHKEPEGVKSLIKAVRNGNKAVWERDFLMNDNIRQNLIRYDLPSLYEEQEADRRRMRTLGLKFFESAPAPENGNGIEEDVGQ